MSKLFRIALAASLLVTTTYGSAQAGRLMGLLGGHARCASSACEPVCQPVCCEPVACEPVACEPAPACCDPAPSCCGPAEVVPEEADCGCGAAATHDAVVQGDVIIEHAPSVIVEPTPAGSGTRAPAEGSGTKMIHEGSGSRPASPPAATTLPPVPTDGDPAPELPTEPELFADEDTSDLEEPAVIEASAEEPMPIVEDLPFEEPATPAVEEPIFEEPATVAEEPAPAADDELFGPAEEPAAADAGDSDLFVEEPAAPAEDDLFGAPAEEPAMEKEPMVAEAVEDDLFGAPAEEPTEDDLFGSPVEEPAAAAEDDLFAAPAEEAPAPEVENDLFGAPAEEEPAGDDDLFGDIADEVREKAGSDKKDDAFDLFNDTGERLDTPVDPFERLHDPGGLRSNEMRLWTDNSGLYRTLGRLASVEAGAVRLIKSDGQVALVAFDRLSGGDLDFVQDQQDLSRIERITRTALR